MYSQFKIVSKTNGKEIDMKDFGQVEVYITKDGKPTRHLMPVWFFAELLTDYSERMSSGPYTFHGLFHPSDQDQ